MTVSSEHATLGPAAPPALVAGAGPVGLATALLLSAYGVPTVVLEARTEPAVRDAVGSKAICMQRDVLDLLDRVATVETAAGLAGVGTVLAREGVTWSRGVTYYREHELYVTTFPEPGASAFPPFVNISQSRTEDLLLRAAAADPMVDLRFATGVTAVEQEAGGVRVTTSGAGAGEVEGTHLVAADGSRSAIRRLIGVPFDGYSFADQFLIADIRAELPFPRERRFYFDPPWNPGRQVLVHPQPDSVWRIDWQVPGDFDLDAERHSGALDARIRRIVGAGDYELVWLSAYRFSRRLAARFVVDRVLLAGDAAHLMSPFGARGLNSGLQDAENVAWKLGCVRAGVAPEALLASYDDERRAAAEENLRVTAATMRFLVPGSDAEWAHRRDVLERAVTDPAARAEIDSGKLAEPYWYLDSPLTTPSSDPAAFPRQPGVARPPVAGVLCPDGPVHVRGRPQVRRLRQLVGPARTGRSGGSAGGAGASGGFVILVCGADPAPLAAAIRGALGAALAVEVLELGEVDVDGGLAAALDAGPGSVHVVRPDGHLAAVLPAPEPAAVVAALRRALALGLPQETASR